MVIFRSQKGSASKKVWKTLRFLLLSTNMYVSHIDQTKEGVYWLTRSRHCDNFQYEYEVVKVKESCNRPGVAQRVPEGLHSQIFMTFGTWRWWGCQPHAPAAFTPRKYSWYSFSLGAESTPGPWYGRKEYVTEKSSDNTGNRSRDRPTSSAAP